MSTRSNTKPTLLSVFDGQKCLGFILTRHLGYEAFTADERSLGTFESVCEAANVISNSELRGDSRQGATASPTPQHPNCE
jgi:hypothetical protein